MTMQTDDFVFYNNQKYVLVAIEEGKSIISSANFNLHSHVYDTSCYRGYIAEYFIENNTLNGIKQCCDGVSPYYDQKSPKLRLSFTGSMIIAYSRRQILRAIFPEDFLEYDKAFELYFIDGELAEIIDLSFAINEWKILKNECKVESKSRKAQEDFASKKLRYKYDVYKFTPER